MRATVLAEPMCRVISAGRRSPDGTDSLTSASLVMVHRPGSTSAMPRAGTSAARPRRLSATLATPDTEAAYHLHSDSMPRILAGRIEG